VGDLVARASHGDADDPLASFRDRFTIPPDWIYLDGNSLGLPARTMRERLDQVVGEWEREAVLGWEHWLAMGSDIGDELAPLIGGGPGEVAVCDQTSVNLFKLASAALSASGRTTIVSDRGNFPSDLYVLDGIAKAAGGRLVLLPEDPSPAMVSKSLDNDVALVSMSHVSYRSGRMHDAAAITALAHDWGALMLWDLAHSAGSVPVDLNGWGADLAVGCTYKYLNGGPGSPAFLYVRTDLHDRLQQPIAGWFGHADQFGFAEEFAPAHSIRRFLVGTPPIISMTATREGIAITREAGMQAIRTKSVALTSLLIEAVDALDPSLGVSVVTPREPTERGSHVAIRHSEAFRVSTALRRRGVIPDYRAPDVIRFGVAPLYTRFADVTSAVAILEDVLTSGAHLAGSDPTSSVT
jgi:kynureninase